MAVHDCPFCNTVVGILPVFSEGRHTVRFSLSETLQSSFRTAHHKDIREPTRELVEKEGIDTVKKVVKKAV